MYPPFVDGRRFLRIADADPTNDNPWRTALYVERHRKASWDLPPKSSPQYVPHTRVLGNRIASTSAIATPLGPQSPTPASTSSTILAPTLDQLRNLAHFREVSRTTLDRLQDRLRDCRADGCRAAENG